MKACKLTFNGNQYMVNAQGVVFKRIQDCLNIPGFDNYLICDATESDTVIAEVRRLRHNKARRSRNQAMRGLGLVKVRGALGGTYWE